MSAEAPRGGGERIHHQCSPQSELQYSACSGAAGICQGGGARPRTPDPDL